MMRMAECHPDRKHYAKGKCQVCYSRPYHTEWVTPTKATCHPDRPARGRGLCSACYQRLRASPAFVPLGRPARVNTCGHHDQPHYGKGMCTACRTRDWRAKNPERDQQMRRLTRTRRYGITPEIFDSILTDQNRKCALCCKALTKPKDIHIDHCHETGAVRGILCFKCNRALGMFGDNEAGLVRALAYVRRGRKAAA